MLYFLSANKVINQPNMWMATLYSIITTGKLNDRNLDDSWGKRQS
jgi:hypothetical protein